MTDKVPVVVKEGMDKKSAEELKAKLEAAGCKVELK
jgi:ribosomal protein L7/L12